MIVSLHVATGAAVGAVAGSRLAALALGPPLHLACDRVPHEDIVNRRFEIRSGLFALALLALSRGPLDPATLGAAAASAPDLEHVFSQLRPHGRKLFHGGRGWHRSGGFRADVQLCPGGRDHRPTGETTPLVGPGMTTRRPTGLRDAFPNG